MQDKLLDISIWSFGLALPSELLGRYIPSASTLLVWFGLHEVITKTENGKPSKCYLSLFIKREER